MNKLFSVLVPNAQEVSLLIDKEYPMQNNNNGTWSCECECNIGDVYWFLIDGKKKIDIYSNCVNTNGESVVYDSTYVFKNPRVTKPLEKVIEFKMDMVEGSTYLEKTTNMIEMAEGYSHVQLMPIVYTPNLKKTMGYKTSTFFAVDPQFGNLDEAKEMVDMFHAAGYGVILDSSVFEFEEYTDVGLQMYDGTYMYERDGAEKHDIFGGYWFDFTKPYARQLLKDALHFYEQELMVDGFRLDGINEMIFHYRDQQYINWEMVEYIKELLNNLLPEAIVMIDFLTHRTLDELGFDRVNFVEGSMLQFQLQNILEKGTYWLAKHTLFESEYFNKSIAMMDTNRSLTSLNHDIYVTGWDGVLNRDYHVVEQIMYAIPKPKQLWFGTVLEPTFKAKIDSLEFNDFDIKLTKYQKVVMNFYGTVHTRVTFDLFRDRVTFDVIE